MSPRPPSPLGVVGALLALGCSGGTPTRSMPPDRPAPSPEVVVPPSSDADEGPTADLDACARRAPTPSDLRSTSEGVLVVDARAPQVTGECVSPAALLGGAREDAPAASLVCDATGRRCSVGTGGMLLAWPQGQSCVPFALVTGVAEAGEGALDRARDEAEAQHAEACALHARVTAGEAEFFSVPRARTVAPTRRGALAVQCLAGAEATALAETARRTFGVAPIACLGLRCRVLSGTEVGDAAGRASSWLFAHRLAGPLRFDGTAQGTWAELREALRTRCR